MQSDENLEGDYLNLTGLANYINTFEPQLEGGKYTFLPISGSSSVYCAAD